MRKSKMCSGGIKPGTEHAERRGVVKPFPANGLSFPLEKCPLVTPGGIEPGHSEF